MTNNQYLDVEDYARRMDNDVELMIELYQIFLEDSKTNVAEITDAIMKNDARALRTSAHTLKGSSSCISAKVIQDLAYELEKMANDGDLSNATSIMDKLRSSCERTEVEIQNALVTLCNSEGKNVL
jgi:HPt (histidine-containing phosphotransfer) domain-containing protein